MKFENFNSNEQCILNTVFQRYPLMDLNISKIVESFIYQKKREYYPSNNELKLNKEYIIKYDKLEGEYKEWYNDGQLRLKTTYVDNKIHGEYRSWWSNGQIFIQTTYIDDKKDG